MPVSNIDTTQLPPSPGASKVSQTVSSLESGLERNVPKILNYIENNPYTVLFGVVGLFIVLKI